MSGKPMCFVRTLGAIVLFWVAWNWAQPRALGAPPPEVNPVAGPAKAVGAPRKDMPAADPFGASSGRSGDKKTSVGSTGGKKQAAKKAQVVAPDKHGPTANLTGAAYGAVAEAKIHKALDSLTELDFVDTPLTDVVTYLQDLHNINITIDHKAMSDAGSRADVQITRTLKGTTLRSALRLMLRDLRLTYVIGDEVLLITTREEAQNRPVTKHYAVADLVAVRDENDKPWDDYRTLIRIVTEQIAPATWEENGGVGSIGGATFGNAKLLFVLQTEEVHEEIARLLEELTGEVKRIPGDRQPPVRPRPHLPRAAATGGKQIHGSGSHRDAQAPVNPPKR
jgi:hypothetical protein